MVMSIPGAELVGAEPAETASCAVLEPGAALALCGCLDGRSASEVRAALHEAIEAGAGDLVVDVSGVDLVDATGLGVLLGAHRRAVQVERRIVLRDASPRLVRILRLTRLHRVFILQPAGD